MIFSLCEEALFVCVCNLGRSHSLCRNSFNAKLPAALPFVWQFNSSQGNFTLVCMKFSAADVLFARRFSGSVQGSAFISVFLSPPAKCEPEKFTSSMIFYSVLMVVLMPQTRRLMFSLFSSWIHDSELVCGFISQVRVNRGTTRPLRFLYTFHCPYFIYCSSTTTIIWNEMILTSSADWRSKLDPV